MSETKKKRILLVEDEALIAMAERRVLESAGYEVTVVHTGEKAVAMVPDRFVPDLILMDIDLGPGIDGTEAAQAILKERDVPIVFLSSHTEKEYTDRAEQITSYGYIVKNANNTVLLASIRMAFRLSAANTALRESEAELRESQELALVGRWDYWHGRESLQWTALIYRIFELDETEFEPSYEAFLAAIHPEDRVAVDTAWRKSLADVYPYEIEHRLLMGDGRVKWVREYCRTVFDDAGLPVHSVGIVQDITGRKTTELTLAEQKHYLETILETTSDGFWVVTPDGKIDNVNAAYCRMSGYSRDELARMRINDVDALESPRESTERVKRIMSNGSETFETQHRRKDGSLLDVEVSVSRFDRSDGTGARLVCFCRDITQRQKTRQELEESRRQYETLIERFPDIIYLFGTTSGGIFWSEATRRILGYEPQDIVRNPSLWSRSVHDEDRLMVETAIAEAIKGEPFTIEYRIRTAHGDWIWLRDQLIDRTERDGEIIIQGHAEDITEQKRNQQQLSERDALLDEVLENMLDLVAITDLNGSFLYAGRSHECLGYSVSSLIGQDVMDYVHPDDFDSINQKLSDLLESGNDTAVEYRYRCADGSYVWLETAGRLLKNEDGIPSRILFNSRDVTERRQWENVLENERRRLSAIIEGTNVGTWEWNAQTGETRFNERWATIVGYTLDEISPTSIHTWQRFTHPEDLERSEQLLRAHFDGDAEVYEAEVRMRHKDGRWVWVLDRGKVASWSEDRQPEWVFGTHQEITDRKKLEGKHLALAGAASTLQGFSRETIDYADIAETARHLSGARYAAFNLFSPNRKTFTTRAVVGLPEHIQRADKLLGLPIVGRTWNYDPDREAALAENRTTVFASLGSLVSQSLSASITNRIAGAFRIGEVVVVRIATTTDIQGDFTLLFSDRDHLQDKDLVETYSSMVGITLERIETALHNSKLVADKETLLREVHHRIKNNMNTMTSLLSLHAGSVEDAVASRAIRDAESRMRSLQALYDQLSLSVGHSRSSLVAYLRTLVPQVVNLFPAGNDVAVSVTSRAAHGCTMDVKRLSTVGLIVNELVTNTMKYAFPSVISSQNAGANTPAIDVAIDCADEEIVISVEDNGVGLRESSDRKNSSGLGMMMIDAMTGQLEGKLTYESGRANGSGGTRVVLRFPSDE